MKFNNTDKFIAYLALLSGLSISAVAIYYSVAGLMAIFAAAVIPIMIMGIVLEVGKLAATVWLKQNWMRAPRFLKTYLLLAILALMLLTSMGIFGYLSKAHLDQAVPTGDVAAKVNILDEKIKTEKDNIETARTALKQMDAQVDARLSRSDDEKGAERAVQIRRQQQAERGRLQKDIADAQTRIAKLNEERAPIASELRKVEAEVGPIKYIAALIYGDNADQNLLERAVRWVIIVIVLVFDPLAVILLLASQYSFQWFRNQEDDEGDKDTEPHEEMASDIHELNTLDTKENTYIHSPWPFPVQVSTPQPNEDDFKFLAEERDLYPEGKQWEEKEESKLEDKKPIDELDENIAEAEKAVDDENAAEDKKPLDEWNLMIAEAEKAIKDEEEKEEIEILESVEHDDVKEAMKAWKHDNPESSLKFQRQLLEKGIIDNLPWENYLKPQADYVDDAVVEAKKWADENPATEEAVVAKQWVDEKLDERPGDYVNTAEVAWMEHDDQGNQIKKVKDGYKQNAEQSDRTIWQRIQDAKK